MIKEINEFLFQMNSSTSSNDKVEIISSCTRNVRRILYYTYNNFLQYHVTSKVLKKRKDLIEEDSKYDSIFQLLDSLNQRSINYKL